MNDLTNQRTALRSLFKHLKSSGFSIKSVEPRYAVDDEEVLYIEEDTTFNEIFDYYFVYDSEYLLSVEKDGKSALILQTWWGGTEGLYSDATVQTKEVFDDLEKATESWWDEMEEKEIQF
jgi:hypothetical protein